MPRTDGRGALLLLAATAADLLVGEPPEAVHPVVWMGRSVRPFKALRRGTESGDFALGAGAVLVVASFAALAGVAAGRVGSFKWMFLPLFLLKSSFAIRGLFTRVASVAEALETGDVDAARRAVAQVVSRETAALSPHQVAAAAIESLAENASDSIVAPLFYYLLAGLPGALFYRAVNTLDAEIGYRGEYEWFGKAAARLDDVLNYVPARITALAIAAAALPVGATAREALATMLRDGAETPSPNAGRPMAAMAGALGTELEKPGVYVLGRGLRKPDEGDIRRALAIAATAVALALGCAFALLVFRDRGQSR